MLPENGTNEVLFSNNLGLSARNTAADGQNFVPLYSYQGGICGATIENVSIIQISSMASNVDDVSYLYCGIINPQMDVNSP